MSRSEMKHSQEPWELREVDGLFAVACADGFVFEGSDDQNRVDWHRAILCVNTCRFCSDEDLADYCVEKMKTDLDKLLEEKQKLYGWLDYANLRKNKYLARAEKAEGDAIKNADLYLAASRDSRAITAQRDDLTDTLKQLADQLEGWANATVFGSVDGTWSTHLVEPMRKKADELRLIISGVERI